MPLARRQSSYARVLADVFVLRQAIQFNRLDNDLKDNGIQFAYFVDPALVGLYVEPAKWANKLTAFPSLGPGATGRSANAENSGASLNALRATSLLTGEYIFSRTLLGPAGDLYVSPDHFAELLDYVAKIERQHAHAVREFAAQIETSPEIADIIVRRIREARALKKAGIGSEEEVEAWRRALVDTLGKVTTENLVITRRLYDLFGQRLLATASIREDFTLDIMAPSMRRVGEWTELIRNAKRHNRKLPAPEAIEADAVTLEQIWLLNAGADQVRFVLITDDSGLHSAYQAMCRREPGVFSALRRPIQFTPILNLSDMGGAFQAKELFDQIESGVDHIAQAFSSSDEPEDDDHIIDFLDGAIPSVTGPQAKLNDRLIDMAEEIRGNWKKLVNYASSAKADIFPERALEDEGYWMRFVRSKSFRQRFIQAGDTFREEAVSLSASSSLLRHEVWALHAVRDREGANPDDFSRRKLASNFMQFDSPSLQGQTLPSVVDQWMRLGPEALEALQRVKERNERLLCIGALCLEIGAWGAAYRLLEESLSTPAARPGAALEEEARFFHAMAARLAATEKSWTKMRKGAETSLARLRWLKSSDVFKKARLVSEEVAFTLCQVPWLHALSQRAQISTILGEAEGRAEELLLKHLPALLEQSSAAHVAAVVKQICLNVFCLTAWRAIHSGHVPGRLRGLYDRYAQVYAEDWMVSFASGPHADTYPTLARLAMSSDREERRRDAMTVIGRIDRLLAKDVAASFAFDMPAVDKKEFHQLRDWARGFL